MTRKQAILALFTLPLGTFNAFKVEAQERGKGVLTINLDQWAGVDVVCRGATVKLSPVEIFRALEGK